MQKNTKNKNFTGKLAKTVGSSAMLDDYAKELDIEVVETPVGFKWLGEAMRKDDIIIIVAGIARQVNGTNLMRIEKVR